MVATKLAEVNGDGKAFRYGGEEFSVIFPEKSVEEAIPYLQRLRGKIEESPLPFEENIVLRQTEQSGTRRGISREGDDKCQHWCGRAQWRLYRC